MASSSEAARYRVSDVSEVPLRGFILRLRVLEGEPSMKDLKGGRLKVAGPEGAGRVIEIRDFAVTAGRSSQKRLDRYKEVDVIISAEDALGAPEARAPIRLGWTAVLDRDG